ncbi:hypothetical protein WBP07_12755 [Novosphingobium sp. BL-8A]|uniref:hypothetical protein n=1 Tax=Novosphingobium sp. BL-8A TaxID=3127639 RepID=UPI0037565350
MDQTLAPGLALMQEYVGAELQLSWAALSVIAGTANQTAVVPNDAGDHIDPVSHLSVPNTGFYRWIQSSGAWQWISDTQAGIAAQQADAAAISAATAESAAGPTYASVAAGLAATASGQAFAVDDGDGTVSIYLNDGGTAVFQRKLATTDYLASPAGALGVGTADGSNVEQGLAKRSTDLAAIGYPKLVFSAAVPRQPAAGGGFASLNDAGHEPGNLSGAMTVVNRNLVIPFGYTANRVGTFQITPDETFAALGLNGGASVAFDKATVSFFMPLYIYGNMSSIPTTAGTAGLTVPTFFVGDVTGIKSGSDVTITHPSCGALTHTPAVTQIFQAADVVAWENRCIGFTTTTVVIATFIDFVFTVTWNGTAWVVTTPMAVTPTVAFSAGVLTVNFGQTLPSNMLYAQLNSPYHATVKGVRRNGNMTTTTIPISFVDSAGGLLTTEQAGMTATVSIPVKVKAATPLGRVAVLRPNTSVDADKIRHDDGNFFVWGAHKLATTV